MVVLGVDVELTNRCNATCYFCPRDQTPHQGLMSPETFEQALHRTVEYREVLFERTGQELVAVNLCGLGEPLLNRNAPEFCQRVREEGFRCQLISNGSLLDEHRARALLDAGVQSVWLNVGERDEAYEEIYELPFEKTRDNVLRFAEMAGDECEVHIVLVDHRQDPEHMRDMRQYWIDRGISNFMQFPIMNRGGSLFVDHMQYETYPELAQARAHFEDRGAVPPCTVPFLFPIIGYDGQYYLCCSDWRKEVPLGSVFDESLVGIVGDKLARATSREPICKTCNHDPLNVLTDELRAGADAAHEARSPESTAEDLTIRWHEVRRMLEQLQHGVTTASSGGGRRRIPVVPR